MEPGWQGALIIDDPVKPDDAYSRSSAKWSQQPFQRQSKSRLAIETTPMIVIMQRNPLPRPERLSVAWREWEKWHHLNLPVIIDNSRSYEETYPENTTLSRLTTACLMAGFGRSSTMNRTAYPCSHRRTAEAQYMQKPRRFNAEARCGLKVMISAARELQIHHERFEQLSPLTRRQQTAMKSDETGIVVASSYGAGDKNSSLLMVITAANIHRLDGQRKPYGLMSSMKPTR